MYALREQYKSETSKLVDIVRSHYNVPYKNKLALQLLRALCGKDSSQATADDKKLFDELGMLTSKETSPVSVRARQILIQSTLPSFKRRCLDMEIFIQTAVENIGDTAANSLQQLVDEGGAVFDVLTHMFSHKNEQIQRAGVCSFTNAVRVPRLARSANTGSFAPQHWRCTCGARIGRT